MRVLAALFFIPLLSYIVIGKIALDARPLNVELAYDALVDQLKKTETGRHSIDLSEMTFMQRDKELIFFGRGQIRRKDQARSGMPLIERFDFQYIVVMTRICDKWESECYKANELEITGKKQAAPMV